MLVIVFIGLSIKSLLLLRLHEFNDVTVEYYSDVHRLPSYLDVFFVVHTYLYLYQFRSMLVVMLQVRHLKIEMDNNSIFNRNQNNFKNKKKKMI